jgi:hypothetical protein
MWWVVLAGRCNDYHFEFENIFRHESGAQVSSIEGKTRGRKSRAIVHLNRYNRAIYPKRLVQHIF